MSKLPLRDRLVVLTRPEGRGADWKAALTEAGAAVSELPLLEIKFEPDDTVLSEVLDAMGEYDWLVFTSANGVRGFFDRFFERFTDIIQPLSLDEAYLDVTENAWGEPLGMTVARRLKDEIYRVAQQMALGVENNAASVGRSAESKEVDSSSTETCLKAYASPVREAAEISQAMGYQPG